MVLSGRWSAAGYSASKPASKWVHCRGLRLILGLGRSAVLCNMLKLMRCNKCANPPKACPLWQKHKAFRQARRCLCLSRRRAGSSQRVSVSLRETPWTWLIVRDMCPGSPPREQEVSSEGARGDVVAEGPSCTSSDGRCVRSMGAYREASGQNQVCCAARAHVCTWMETHRLSLFIQQHTNCTVIIRCCIYVNKCIFFVSLKTQAAARTRSLSDKLSISPFSPPSNPELLQQMLFMPLLALSHILLPNCHSCTLIVQCLANWSADVIALLCIHAKLPSPNWQIKQLCMCASFLWCVYVCARVCLCLNSNILIVFLPAMKSGGTQLKLIMTFQNYGQALFKPMK